MAASCSVAEARAARTKGQAWPGPAWQGGTVASQAPQPRPPAPQPRPAAAAGVPRAPRTLKCCWRPRGRMTRTPRQAPVASSFPVRAWPLRTAIRRPGGRTPCPASGQRGAMEKQAHMCLGGRVGGWWHGSAATADRAGTRRVGPRMCTKGMLATACGFRCLASRNSLLPWQQEEAAAALLLRRQPPARHVPRPPAEGALHSVPPRLPCCPAQLPAESQQWRQVCLVTEAQPTAPSALQPPAPPPCDPVHRPQTRRSSAGAGASQPRDLTSSLGDDPRGRLREVRVAGDRVLRATGVWAGTSDTD